MPPDSTYCAYGADTTLIQRSSDGGATWRVLDAPTGSVSGITFVNENDGWLTGSACTYPDCVKTSTIFRTANGGATWQAVDTSAYGTIESLTFEDAVHGWAWTLSCHGGQCINDLLSTTDGGATWYQESMTESGPSTYGQSLVRRGGTLYLTARSGSALRSRDAGRIWEPMTTPALEFQGVEFVNAQVGFAVSGGGIIGTRNAGADWQRLAAAPGSASLLEFVDPLLGFAGSPNCGSVQCSPTISRTTDGGVTWTAALSQPPVTEEGGIAYLEFIDSQHGWAVTQKRFFFTNDGGGTWRERRLADPASFIIAADMADATRAWAITQTCSPTHCDFELVRSIDAGVTWTNVRALTTSGYPLQFADRDHGWYVDQLCTDTFNCQWALVATSDGGTTWDELDIPSYPQDIEFTDARNGWLNVQTCDLECAGRVLHTIDGGRTWTEQLNGPLLIGDLEFADARNGWIALASYRGQGIGGGPPNRTVLYHTSDGGGGVSLPDVGGGTPGQTNSPLLPLLLAAAGVMALTTSFAVRRVGARGARPGTTGQRPYPSTKSPS